jgi:hypothetical protein
MSSSLVPAVPACDRVVVALWRRGAAQAAMEVALAAVSRGDPRWPHCGAALDKMRRGESPDDDGPAPELDLVLVSTLLDLGLLLEARSVLRGAGLGGALAQRLSRTLDEALEPFPPEADPSFEAVLQLVRAGQAPSALRALEEVVRQSPAPARWLVSRQRALASLLRGLWREVSEPVEEITRDTVLARLRARDLPAALTAARAAGASELAEVLTRLVEGTERVLADTSSSDDDPETVPIEGHRLAELHIRMGVLGEADRSYRSILRHEPADERARTMLSDVIALRRALGEAPEPMPPRASASVGWLKKNAPRAAVGKGWSAGPSGRYAAWGEETGDDSTAMLEASQEAELLLELGKAQQALDVYRILAIRHPKQQAYRKRILEVEALIAQKMTPIAAELTERHDLSELLAQAVPTSPRVLMPEVFVGFEEIEDVTTAIDRRRDDEDD